MQSISTLDVEVFTFIENINDVINNTKYWTQFSYNEVFESLDKAIMLVSDDYRKVTGVTLEETSRRIFENVQGGGIETFINFYNAFLFIRKLQYKLQWHRKYGVFPNAEICK